MKFDGIHHITAITGDAPRNVRFYTGTLGLRLTAKSVNQDDPTVYHLFYGDEQAQPGADLTFFEYPRAIPGRAGAGMVHRIVWRVGSEDALRFWHDRLTAAGVAAEREDGSLRFPDPEGLEHELIVYTGDDKPLIADHPEIPAELALQGFDGVRAYSRAADATGALLERFMNGSAQGEDTVELRGGARGGWYAMDPPPQERGRQSAGTIHHVAFHTTLPDHGRWLEKLESAGIQNSGVIDRHFFQSIYFREPGGVLFELATLEPGFTIDGPVEDFGKKILLPPWLEDRRDEVERRLTPLPDPRADWPVTG